MLKSDKIDLNRSLFFTPKVKSPPDIEALKYNRNIGEWSLQTEEKFYKYLTKKQEIKDRNGYS